MDNDGRIPESSSSTQLPWYKRLFHHEETESEEEEIDSTVLQIQNLHKTYLLGLGYRAIISFYM